MIALVLFLHARGKRNKPAYGDDDIDMQATHTPHSQRGKATGRKETG